MRLLPVFSHQESSSWQKLKNLPRLMILKARGRHRERERERERGKKTTFIQLGKTFCSLWSWHLVFSFTIGESVTKHAHMLGAFHPIPCLAFCIRCVSRGPCERRHPGRMWWCDGGAWWLGGGDASWRGMELNGPSKTGHSRRMPKSLCDNLHEILISFDHAWKILKNCEWFWHIATVLLMHRIQSI